jgi:hypothetical protein
VNRLAVLSHCRQLRRPRGLQSNTDGVYLRFRSVPDCRRKSCRKFFFRFRGRPNNIALEVEVPYTEEDADRDQQAVIDCLYRAEWIEKWCESDGNLMIQWTEKGKTGVQRLRDFYDGAGAGDLNGRQIALFGLIAYASSKIGIDHNNVSLIGHADLSLENGTNPKRDAA